MWASEKGKKLQIEIRENPVNTGQNTKSREKKVGQILGQIPLYIHLFSLSPSQTLPLRERRIGPTK